jgi:hypothetical protein
MKFAAIRDLQIKASDVVKKAEHEPVTKQISGNSDLNSRMS